MGKKKDIFEEGSIDVTGLDDSESASPPHKKHKKHKKHKHKKKRDLEGELGSDPTSQGEESPSKQPSIKLKIKIGGQTLSTKSVTKHEIVDDTSTPSGLIEPKWEVTTIAGGDEPLVTTKKTGDDISDEEREWLDALEAGKLDESGGIKKSKDPQLMTARQRSLLHGNKEEQLVALPSGYKVPELTEEQLQRKLQRAIKRREQAQAKTEKDKKLTLDRLLKKQDTKGKGKNKAAKRYDGTRFRYMDTSSGITISVPEGTSFPLPVHTAPSDLKPVLCGVQGCCNLKKYSCSKTGVPLCSLQCYKQNLLTVNTMDVKPSIPVTVT